MKRYRIQFSVPGKYVEELERKTKTILGNYGLSDKVDIEVNIVDVSELENDVNYRGPSISFSVLSPSGKVIRESRPGTRDFPVRHMHRCVDNAVSWVEFDIKR